MYIQYFLPVSILLCKHEIYSGVRDIKSSVWLDEHQELDHTIMQIVAMIALWVAKM